MIIIKIIKPNLIGMGIFLAAASIAALFGALLSKFTGDWFLSYGKPVCFVAMGVFLIVLDLWYRMTREERSLWGPRHGGHFFFVPVWILGGLWIVAILCETLGSKTDVSARQSDPYSQTSVSQPSSPPLKLGMISGAGSHRIATINGQPFAEGESHTLTIGSTKLAVQCTEIREQSVVVKTSGDSQPRELKIGEPLMLNGR